MPKKRVTTANALVLSGYGLNCEQETMAAFTRAGARGDIVHLNDLIANPALLNRYNILVFPGGFSYGDGTGSGRAYANKVRNNLTKELQAFVRRDTLTIGICNGFQILTQVGLLPGSLIHNIQARYIVRWVDLEVKGESPWLKGISNFSLPVAHGEGRYYIDRRGKQQLGRDRAIACRYVEGDYTRYADLPANPNGSLDNIAGVTAYEGRVIGLMPHPERGVSFLQLPHWPYLKETQYAEKRLPSDGPGLQMFTNAVRYFSR